MARGWWRERLMGVTGMRLNMMKLGTESVAPHGSDRVRSATHM
jgi:hypothetical protein